MTRLVIDNSELNYQVHRSGVVTANHAQMLVEINRAIDIFKREFKDKDTTWSYRYYNTFALTAPSLLFYELYQELTTIIRNYAGHDRPLWMQSWINYHMPQEVLDWHDHAWPFHGYVSIDPKESKTVFEEYKIHNKIGNIYIGPGSRKHKVEVLERFYSPRITLGFDVLDTPSAPTGQFSLLPI